MRRVDLHYYINPQNHKSTFVFFHRYTNASTH
nr:MAG TPA: hypothetical protein [Caudoviricetes sp.]DAV10029.1 MAG TPA: hypothetical protein [Caudoviricetes sp.]